MSDTFVDVISFCYGNFSFQIFLHGIYRVQSKKPYILFDLRKKQQQNQQGCRKWSKNRQQTRKKEKKRTENNIERKP